jgi:type IV pilus assembly protein PilO
MEQLLERIAKAPIGTKVGGVVLAVALITVLNYFAFGLPSLSSISELETKIKRVNAEQQRVNAELIEKQAIANDLNRFRKEKELLEQRLKQALAELPEDKKLDELLQMFQDQAQKAGLEIVSIVPEAPVSAGFYVRLPIKMAVNGNFHEIATFFDATSRLRRIVNVSDLTLDNPKEVSGKVVIAGSFTATTFMFAEGSKGKQP